MLCSSIESLCFCRINLLDEMAGAPGDVLLAALALSAEDDAISTKSTCDLPVQSYSERMNSLVTQLGYQMDAHAPDLSEHSAAINYVTSFLFDTMGYTVAEKPLELYSPYRIYMHRVLAQRCGTPEAISIVLCSLLQRAAEAGLFAPFEVQVGIPAPGNHPVLRASGTQDHDEADVKCAPLSFDTRSLRTSMRLDRLLPLHSITCVDTAVFLKAEMYDNAIHTGHAADGAHRRTVYFSAWSTSRGTFTQYPGSILPHNIASTRPIQDMRIEFLSRTVFGHRYFWSWEWDVGASESFMTPARAFLGDFGRAGVGSATVGVMQITGRCALQHTVAGGNATCERYLYLVCSKLHAGYCHATMTLPSLHC